jgi:hypothetical protein
MTTWEPPRATGMFVVITCYNEACPMTKELQELLNAAKDVKISSEQKEEQRRSFAFGNTNIENPRITREIVDKEADALKR